VDSEVVVYTEDETDGIVNPAELVIGKKKGSELKMSVIVFDLKELFDEQEDQDIWIYESNIFLTTSPTSDRGKWIPQTTHLHRLAVPLEDVVTNRGQLTSEQNIDESTGQFRELTKMPRRNKKMVTSFTDTIHKWLSPYNKDKNEDYYGVAIVNQYTDEPERTDAAEVRYVTFNNVTDKTLQPWIDVCYKTVEVKECTEPDVPKTAQLESSFVLVEGEDGNRPNETLTHGMDNDGKKYRTVLKFNVENFSDKFKTYEITESFIHLNYLGPSDEDNPATRTVFVHKITSPWTEDDLSWDTVKYDPEPSGQLKIKQHRLGGTEVTIEVHELAKEWILDSGTIENYGVILIDDKEEIRSSIPQYAHDDTEPYHYTPEMTICEKPIHTSTTPTAVTTSVVPTSRPLVTQTTPFITNEPFCQEQTRNPIEELTLWVVNGTTIVDPDDYDEDERTLCVSVAKIPLKYCWDKTGRCKKQQSRSIYGKIQTDCKCCLPVMAAPEVHIFDCQGTRTELKPRLIESCKCLICGSEDSTMKIIEPNEVISDKRAANPLQLIL